MSEDPELPDLVSRAAAGDGDAVVALWRSHRAWVAAVLMAHKPARSELEDLMQDVAAKLVAGVEGVRDSASFRPWLRAVALNVARSEGRKANVRRGGRSLDAMAVEPLDPRGERDAAHDAVKARLARVMEILEGMHPDYREPLMLRAVDGMSQQAIADLLEVPITTIETRLARGRRMVRQAMDVRVIHRGNRRRSGGT